MSSLTPHSADAEPRYKVPSPASLTISVLVHAVVVWGLAQPQVRYPKPPPMVVQLAAAPTPPPPPPPPVASPTQASAPPAAPKAAQPVRRQALTPDPPPERIAPIALSDVAFSNFEGGLAVGQPAVQAAPAPPVAAPAKPAPRPAVVSEAQPVALADLSRRPQAPQLNAALREHYPAEHRRTGTAGEASVRVLLSEQGQVLRAQLLKESAQGFGEACRKTLLQSNWSAPLDREGRPARTQLTYRCKFTVDS